jgi:hypothetical protein
MDQKQLLAEIVVAIANIDYDLRRWREELEQCEYATLLDNLIDFHMNKPVGDNFVDVTYYTESGVRVVIGTAVIHPDGKFHAMIHPDDVLGLTAMSPARINEHYSIGYDKSTREVYATEKPAVRKIEGDLTYPLVDGLRMAMEEIDFNPPNLRSKIHKAVHDHYFNTNETPFIVDENPNTPSSHFLGPDYIIKENQDARPEVHSHDRGRTYRLPQLRRPRGSDEPGGGS